MEEEIKKTADVKMRDILEYIVELNKNTKILESKIDFLEKSNEQFEIYNREILLENQLLKSKNQALKKLLDEFLSKKRILSNNGGQ